MHDAKQGNIDKLGIPGRIVAVLENVHTHRKCFIPGCNIVADTGDTYYAQRGCGSAVTSDFVSGYSGLRLGTEVTTPTKADTDVGTFVATGTRGLDAGYPKTSDPDTDNTGSGADIVSYRYSFGTADAIINSIAEGAIVVDVAAGGTALTHFLFAAAFNKTANDTLKVFVNHEMIGTA
ncbi:MAG: hypothetical protein ACFFD4_07560 [Candidatus Odinarchaeota archaeon]